MMHRRIITSMLCICFAGTIQAQEVSDGTVLQVMSGTHLETTRDVLINSGGELRNEGMVTFKSNLYNSGPRLIGGDVVAAGSSEQTIGGSDSIAFNHLMLNNKAGVVLASKTAITNMLTLEQGVLRTSDEDPVAFTATANTPTEHAFSYIYGTTLMDPRPVGTGSLDFIGVAINEGTDLGNVSITRHTGDNAIMTIGDGSSIASHWDINSTSENTEGHNVSFTWVDAFDNNLDIEDLSLYGNIYFDEDRYIKLDNVFPDKMALTVSLTKGTRTYRRAGLDYLNREYTLADRLAQAGTIELTKITAFPNPVSDRINLLLENYELFHPFVKISIADATGKIMYTSVYPINGNIITLDNLGGLPTGVYRLFLQRGQKVQAVNFNKF